MTFFGPFWDQFLSTYEEIFYFIVSSLIKKVNEILSHVHFCMKTFEERNDFYKVIFTIDLLNLC
jgi:hypothetical protein